MINQQPRPSNHRKPWPREEVWAAGHLWIQAGYLPETSSKCQTAAALFGRTPSSLAWCLSIFNSLDQGTRTLSHSTYDREFIEHYHANPGRTAVLAKESFDRLVRDYFTGPSPMSLTHQTTEPLTSLDNPKEYIS